MPPPPPGVVAPVQVDHRCVAAAAGYYALPPEIIVSLRIMEGGKVGAVSVNKNGTRDIGPLQINSRNVPGLAVYGITEAVLKDNECVNLFTGAYWLRSEIDHAGGNFWEGVGHYHSPTPSLARGYERSIQGILNKINRGYAPYVSWLRRGAEMMRASLLGRPVPAADAERGPSTVTRQQQNG